MADKSAKDKVAELSSKDQRREFGDLTKLIVSRASQLTMKDATMLLKALLSFNVGLSSVGGCAHQVFGGKNFPAPGRCGERFAGMVAVEIDKGEGGVDRGCEYRWGPHEAGGEGVHGQGGMSGGVRRSYALRGAGRRRRDGVRRLRRSTAIDVELAEELDRWDARFLAARDADATEVG